MYRILHTLAFELARLDPAARTSVVAELKTDLRLNDLNLSQQVDRLLITPLRASAESVDASQIVLVLDGLDECAKMVDLIGPQFLGALVTAISAFQQRKVKALCPSSTREPREKSNHDYTHRDRRRLIKPNQRRQVASPKNQNANRIKQHQERR